MKRSMNKYQMDFTRKCIQEFTSYVLVGKYILLNRIEVFKNILLYNYHLLTISRSVKLTVTIYTTNI